MNINTIEEARNTIYWSFPKIVEECRAILGSELHYQAVIYHCLRTFGKIPIEQIGMNVKIGISNPVTQLFKDKQFSKAEGYQAGFEPIPDICIFSTELKADWRRRNNENTLKETLYALEIKASERKNNRLTAGEIKNDIDKLQAQFEETFFRYKKEIGKGVLIVDTAPKLEERIKEKALNEVEEYAKLKNVDFWYFSHDKAITNQTKMEFSSILTDFIANQEWTFAKTYAETWPHEYIVQEKVDNKLFINLANHIDKFGYIDKFYQKTVIYFDYNGYTYWHMENIINRCVERDTYHRREIDGRLPNFNKY